MSFALLALDVLFGVSVLDAVVDLDIHTDAALDLLDAGFTAARGSNDTAGTSFRLLGRAWTVGLMERTARMSLSQARI